MPFINRPVTVIKRNPAGEETLRYPGVLTYHQGGVLRLTTSFGQPDMPFGGIVIRRGDPFVEIYYTDRWYNIFEIHDRDTGAVKGWYCNICKPAVLESTSVISYVDLALDFWVTPEGTRQVMDEDEFAALELDNATRGQAIRALDELKSMHFPVSHL